MIDKNPCTPARGPARRSFARGLAGLLVLALGACQSAPQLPRGETLPPPVYTLGPGDKVRVTVFQHDELSGVFEVDSSGRVALPLIRGVQAVGMSVPEFESVIIARLAQQKLLDAKVSVDLVKTRPVCVLGEVQKPGCFDYIYGMRAASAIAMAGGYTYRAKQDALVVMRGDGLKVQGGHDILVYPGDVVTVAERLF